MGEDIALHIGAADTTWGDLRFFALAALAAGGALFVPWVRWHFRGWRIRRAEARGDHERAEILAFDQEGEDPPSSLLQIAGRCAIILVLVPGLLVFQLNFADELEHMLGRGWGFAAGMLTIAFIGAVGWVWGRVRRNAMSPEELAALEEEEEHQSWMRAFFNEPAAGFDVSIAIVAVIVIVALYIMIVGWPG